MNKTCGCPEISTRICARCGRRLCAWHCNLQPAIIDGKVATELICAPSCGYHASAPAVKKPEWRPAA